MWLLVGKSGGLLRNLRDGDGDCGTLVMKVDDCLLACSLGKEGAADEMVIKVIPIDLACSYIKPSTSLDTAEVHSSRTAYDGRW